MLKVLVNKNQTNLFKKSFNSFNIKKIKIFKFRMKMNLKKKNMMRTNLKKNLKIMYIKLII